MKKRIIASIITVLLLVSTVFTFASESNNVSELELLQSNQQLQVEINEYFNSKLSDSSCARTYSIEETSELQRNIQVRANGLLEVQGRADIEFVNVDIESEITNVVELSEEKLVLDVYEWTAIEYYASSDSDVIDVMGYGINHEMTFDVVEGEYILVADSFDERHITGVCSDDILLAEEEDTEFVEEVEVSVSENTTRVAYNVQAAVNYANMYCGVPLLSQDFSDIDGVSLSGNHTNLYNEAEYDTEPGVDCANFVSQCIHEGGLQTDSNWKPKNWYWVNARGLASYLQMIGYDAEPADSDNFDNVYPGNPVYWLNAEGAKPSGHQMICTGYNSEGTPVVSGHNPDMFRYPIALLNRVSDLETIQIVTSDQHTHVADGGYYSNASVHYNICKYCRNICNRANHIVVTIGNTQRCSVCGFTGPFPSYRGVSTCGDLGDLPEEHN